MLTTGKITQLVRRGVVAAAAFGALAAPASATATTRYAGVGGSTTDLSCTDSAHPCDLYHIIQSVGPAGDDVVVEPGTYSYPFAITIPRGLDIHGQAGQPRPIVQTSGLDTNTGGEPTSLRYLDLELGSGHLQFGNGTVEQVIVQGGDNTCELGAPLVFRDNVCAMTSSQGPAIDIEDNGGSEHLELRNVTAVTTFNGGSAIHVGTQALGGSVTVDLFNTIARVGGPKGVDISATTVGAGSATVNTNHSNYSTLVPSGPGASINTSVTDQHGAPVFASGSYNEAVGSSATIGKGATQPENGDFDFEGDLRSAAGASDIGADQFVSAPAISGVSAAGTGTTATVQATIAGGGSPTSYTVHYGPTNGYGSTTATASLPASAGVQHVTIPLSGLTAGATYHYRAVVTGHAGQTASDDQLFTEARVPVVVPPVTAPRVGPLTFARSRFAAQTRSARHGGTRISYTDTQRARTTFTVSRRLSGIRRAGRCVAPPRGGRVVARRLRCTRSVFVGSFSHDDRAGLNRIAFSGRMHGHALRPGRYRVVVVPVNGAGKRGGARQHDFVVVG